MSLEAQVLAEVGALTLDVNLALTASTLAIVGPNGSGKTSLLRAILGLLPVKHARVSILGATLVDTETQSLMAVEERKLGYVPQNYALFPHLNVRANVEFALSSQGLHKSALLQRSRQTLEAFELTNFAQRMPHTLSGGEQQRVALARAVAIQPRALLLDEPLAALDIVARAQVRSYLKQTLQALSLPTLIVTHDPTDARVLADEVAVLERGKITQRGSWQQLTEQPATPFVAEFVRVGTENR